jgi:hypothetical protein
MSALREMSNRVLCEKRPFGTPELRVKDIFKMNVHKLAVNLRLDPSDSVKVQWQEITNAVMILHIL